jgi:hypothetical protein
LTRFEDGGFRRFSGPGLLCMSIQTVRSIQNKECGRASVINPCFVVLLTGVEILRLDPTNTLEILTDVDEETLFNRTLLNLNEGPKHTSFFQTEVFRNDFVITISRMNSKKG